MRNIHASHFFICTFVTEETIETANQNCVMWCIIYYGNRSVLVVFNIKKIVLSGKLFSYYKMQFIV